MQAFFRIFPAGTMPGVSRRRMMRGEQCCGVASRCDPDREADKEAPDETHRGACQADTCQVAWTIAADCRGPAADGPGGYCGRTSGRAALDGLV